MTSPFVQRARALIGAQFRIQGRGAEGLDCIGLAIATYAIDTRAVRSNYSLRGNQREELERGLTRFFRQVKATQRRDGDLMLLAPAGDQLHLAVRTPDGFVHAHAGIGRVVETPGEPQWPVLGIYRRRTRGRTD